MSYGPDDEDSRDQLDDFEQMIDDEITNDPDGEYDNTNTNDNSSDE